MRRCNLDSEDFIFQQDNAPCHVSRKSMEWFSKENIKLLKWPANSPDLNPIENLWGLLKKAIHGKEIKNERELIASIINAWSSFNESDILENSVRTIPKRIKEVIESKGGPISY